MASKSRVGSKCRTLWVAILFLASIAAIITIAVIQDKWRVKDYDFEYGIVVDSGSSRSNIYLYKWPGDKQNDTGVVVQVMNCRVPGAGISNMGVNEEKDKASWDGFEDCMKNITMEIPAEKYKNTPLFLGATAGMRLLREEDAKRSDSILVKLRQYFRTKPFMFQDASILTGQQEGLYGWVTVNYLLGNFVEKTLWNAFVRPDGAKTVGSMDLGGASTQLAFAVDGDMHGQDYMPVRLYGYDYNVYTHSYLCYGKNEAESQILDRMVRDAKDLSSIQNPCYPRGANATFKASSIYNSPCTKKPADLDPDQDLVFVAAPDIDKCRAVVRTLFDFDNCTTGDCSFNGVQQPPIQGGFMAYAGFFYITKALLLNSTTEMDQYTSSIQDFCQTHWSELKVTRRWVTDKHLRSYCYSSYYVLTLLAEGYKFDSDTWRHITFEKEVKGTSVGWSLGYMLSMSNMIPSEAKDILPMSSPLFAGLIFLFSALTIVTVVFLFIVLIRTCY